MTGRWTFTPSVLEASREPPLSDAVQLEPLREMLAEVGGRDQVMAAGREAYIARVDRIVQRWKSSARGIPVGGWRRSDGRGPATFFPDHEL